MSGDPGRDPGQAPAQDRPVLAEARALSTGYGGAPALVDVSFRARAGQSVAVLGPNGGGKTTLFRALLGDLPALVGEATLRGRAAYVAQTERARLDFPVNALEVALMGALGRTAWWRPPSRRDRRAAAHALERVGLGWAARERFGDLSGGERQRVLLARALVQDAGVLLLDEPLSGVDRASAETIGAVFEELRRDGRLLMVSTHDIESVRNFDLVLCLSRRQVAFGPPAEVLDRTVLEATYGAEIVVLDSPGGPVSAVAVQHHEH